MAMGGGSGNGPLSEINVTPLVDVMLVLLVIFMVTAPMMTTGLDVNLPQTEGGALDEKTPPIIVAITGGGDISVNDQRTSVDRLAAAVRAAQQGQLTSPVFLKADKTVPYGVVVQVMGALKAAGVEKLGMVTEPPTPSEG
ncbi:MAG: protein TolR [Desulfobacca sp.]|uniref:protein TolR n=1 Tax=Desulfobacca sp. TaxID=2067990 RepID=UPI00404AF3CA